MKNRTIITFFLVLIGNLSVYAAPTKELPYPTSQPTADEIANQIYFVNHFYAVRNVSFERFGKSKVSILALRGKGKSMKINTFRRFLNNNYEDDPEIKARDMVLFHSGKLIGTGILVSEYDDENKSQSYKIWIPSLRKIRKFKEPSHDNVWNGSDFTYGDVYLRKPEHENHKLLGEVIFSDCLEVMNLSDKERKNRYLKNFPNPQCSHKGKTVYKLKSTSKNQDWWYDYRISYVDTTTFADYRTDYFKGEQMVKRIDRDWVKMDSDSQPLEKDDPRAVLWKFWYGKTFKTGHETMAYVPEDIVKWNRDMENEFWSEEILTSLRK